ncbi:MAG: MarR family transcriptional regulator [Anaerolineaceae bacterium]|nr:MarR family transcriptional regulator [Anaerolineaceae bacterium]
MTDQPEEQFMSLLLRLQRSGPGYPPFEETGITPAQFAYLDCIDRLSQATLLEIAAEMEITPASASKAINQLENMALVMRSPNPQDGRSSYLTLSWPGKEAHARITRYRQQKTRALLSRLAPDQRDLFLKLFTQLLTPEPSTHPIERNPNS